MCVYYFFRKLRFELFLSNSHLNPITGVTLKSRYSQETHDIDDVASWKDLFTFNSTCTSVIAGNKSFDLTCNPLSVTAYLFGEYNGFLQFGWFGRLNAFNKMPAVANYQHPSTADHKYGWWITGIIITNNGLTILEETFNGSSTE